MITAAVVSIVFKFLKQPVVLGYIVAGVLVGPHLFGETLVNEENVKAWGDIGVLFVLFCIGLEFRLKNLISSGKVAAVGALTIILGMMLLGYWVGQDAELDMVNSLFLAGIILALGLCLGMVLTAEEAGFSSALGAFVMGSILAETVESHRIEKLMTPLKNVFAAIFFISVGMLINPASLAEYWVSIAYVSLVIIVGMILFGTLGCWWGGQTMRDSMLTSFSFVQIGEFSFIIASLGTSLGVLNPLIYPIIVASSVVTTFLTPYIMKAALPCYTFLYNHASAGLRSKIDQREQRVAETETATPSGDTNSFAEKVRHAVRNTFITKRLVNLFIKNMSAHDENA